MRPTENIYSQVPCGDILTQQFKKENNSELKYMDALSAKFTDDIIIVILHKLFGENSIMAKYQKFGWVNRESGPFAKSKKN